MPKPMAMRSSRKPQFTVMAPPSLRCKFSMRSLGICMTRAVLLRKMNPRGGAGYRRPSQRWLGGNAWQSGASKGENARLPGETEGRTYEEVECGGMSGAGRRVGCASGGGAGCGKEERGTQGGGESDTGGPGAMERHRAEADRHGGGLPRGQVRVQTESGAAQLPGGTPARCGCELFLHQPGEGREAACPGRFLERQTQDQGGSGRLREEIFCRRRGGDQSERRCRAEFAGRRSVCESAGARH